MSATDAKQSRQALAKERNRQKLLQAGLAIEEKNAKLAKSLGFFPSRLVFLPLPVSNPAPESTAEKDDTTVDKKKTKTAIQSYERINGKWKMELTSSSEYGLPYGVYPRIELARIVSLAVKTQSRDLELECVSKHLRDFGIAPSGGKKGTIDAYRNQMLRLFTCMFNRFLVTKDDSAIGGGFRLLDNHSLWVQRTSDLYPVDIVPHIRLSEGFFAEITGEQGGKGNALPFDLRAIKALKQSALQIDVYLFLTYRFNAIRKDTLIPWVSLKAQFGENYANTADGMRNFKKKFIAALKRVLVVYPDATIAMCDAGITLKRSRSHA